MKLNTRVEYKGMKGIVVKESIFGKDNDQGLTIKFDNGKQMIVFSNKNNKIYVI